MRLTLSFSDRSLMATLELRRGVLQITMGAPADAGTAQALHLRTPWPTWLRQMSLGWPDLAPLLAQGEMQLLEGSNDALQAFLACFEAPAERMPLLATR